MSQGELYCKKCNELIEEGWDFCPVCQTPVETSKLTCPSCKREIKENWTKCPFCKTILRGTEIQNRESGSVDEGIKTDGTVLTGGSILTISKTGQVIEEQNYFYGAKNNETEKIETCLICGRNNKLQRTFKCKKCDRSYLCTNHLDQEYNICAECATEIRREEQIRLEREIKERTEKFLSEGENSLSIGKLEEAEKAFNEVLYLENENENALKGIKEIKNNKLSQRIKQLLNEAIHEEWGNENYDASVSKYEEALSMDPKNQEALDKCLEIRLLHLSPDKEKIKALLKAGANINHDRKKYNETADSITLLERISEKFQRTKKIDDMIEYIKVLEGVGIKIETKKIMGKRLAAIVYCQQWEEWEEAKKLIDAGASVDEVAYYDNDAVRTPLFWAIHHDKIDIVKDLLLAGANINAKCEENFSPLMLARSMDRKEMLKLME